MTTKERWLAAANHQPLDRLPFWPKLSAAYPPYQSGRFRTMDLAELYDWTGTDRHLWIPNTLKWKHTHCRYHSRTDGRFREDLFETPLGTCRRTWHYDNASRSWHPSEMPITTREEILIMTCFYEDLESVIDEETLAEAVERYGEIGEDAAVATGIGESPLMYFIEHLASLPGAHYLLCDYQEEVERLFAAMHRNLLKSTWLICERHPADFLYFVENTSTTLISPDQYRRYCKPHLSEYIAVIRKYDRVPVLHMCGHLKALLPDIDKVGARMFEAFTSPGVGNTRLLDGRTDCPDICLCGGTNASLWTRPVKAIIGEIEKDLADLPHHHGLILSSAGVMPPLCDPQTIRTVNTWINAYPARF